MSVDDIDMLDAIRENTDAVKDLTKALSTLTDPIVYEMKRQLKWTITTNNILEEIQKTLNGQVAQLSLLAKILETKSLLIENRIDNINNGLGTVYGELKEFNKALNTKIDQIIDKFVRKRF